MTVKPQTSKSYEWVGYTGDNGLITVREIVTRDLLKVNSQSEALAIISRLKKADDDSHQHEKVLV